MSTHDQMPAEDFSSLFSFLPIGAYRSSPDGALMRANLALVGLNGYASEAEMLAAVRDIGDEWYVEAGRRTEFRRQLERDGFVKSFVSEVRRHKTGERIWIQENAHVVRDTQGAVWYYEGTVEDVTERVHAQQALLRSREQMLLLTQQIPGMVYVVEFQSDGARRYQFVSPGVRELYGLEPEAVLADGSLLSRFRHPEDVAELNASLEQFRVGPVDLVGEFRIVRPDGSVRWVMRRSTTVSRDGAAQVRAGVLIDTTERKQAEMALRQSQAIWKLALESAGDGVWDWNIATGEEFYSTGILKMLGFDEGELKSWSTELDARTHPADLAQMQADRLAHLEGRADVYRNEHRVRCKDGRWIWVLSRGMVIERDEDNQPLRMIGTHTDVTQIKQAEAQQRELEGQLRESQKMEAIGTLAGGVAHDFNNLLAAILGNLTLAREDVGDNPQAQESLGEIHHAAIRARQLVQQILTFSRRQTQEMHHQLLNPLVSEALGLLRTLVPAGVNMRVQVSKRPLAVMADATQVQQVLMNLCTNAWQALEGRAGEITVALTEVDLDAAQALRLGGLPVGEYARLSVADDGSGIDEATQERIFEPFFTTKTAGTGTGLGLAVVHGIVKSHNGAIALTSSIGHGARFDVYLPLAPDLQPAVGEKTSHPETAQSAQVKPTAAPRQRVVYIDDYEALVFLVGRQLRKLGYEVHTFDSGEQALAWMAQNADPLDLVVTDQNMPGMNGVDVVRAARALYPELRIAIVTGQVTEQLLADAKAAGAFEVMAKQDSMEALGHAVRGLLERGLS